MKVFAVTCSYNVSQTLVDCAFKSQTAAVTYAAGLNADKAKEERRDDDPVDDVQPAPFFAGVLFFICHQSVPPLSSDTTTSTTVPRPQKSRNWSSSSVPEEMRIPST